MNTIQTKNSECMIEEGLTNSVEAICRIGRGDKIYYYIVPPCKKNHVENFSIVVKYCSGSTTSYVNSIILDNCNKSQALNFFKLLVVYSVTPCTLQDIYSDYFRV